MSYDLEEAYDEPDGGEWYDSKHPEEQAFIQQTMEQCPKCGEWVSKKSRVLKKNEGICRICRRKQEGYEQF